MNVRSTLRTAALLLATAFAVTLAACGTGTPSTPTAASTPAVSHFNADLTVGFTTIEAVRGATLAAYQSGSLSKPKAQAIETQCIAFTATLKALKALGDTSSSEGAVAAQLAAIQSFVALAALEGVISK